MSLCWGGGGSIDVYVRKDFLVKVVVNRKVVSHQLGGLFYQRCHCACDQCRSRRSMIIKLFLMWQLELSWYTYTLSIRSVCLSACLCVCLCVSVCVCAMASVCHAHCALAVARENAATEFDYYDNGSEK